MGHQLNPLEKEFLIRQYKANPDVGLKQFCIANHVSRETFTAWLKRYEVDGIEGLARGNTTLRDVLPPGAERTEEAYKREILRLRVENERLKKNYTVRRNSNGELVYLRLKPKNSVL